MYTISDRPVKNTVCQAIHKIPKQLSHIQRNLFKHAFSMNITHLVVDGLLSMTRPAIKIALSSKFDLIVLFSNLMMCKRVPDSTEYK